MNFFDFGDMERRRAAGAELAAKAPKGVGLSQIVPGAIFMVSAGKYNGDRSYTDNCLEVLAVAGHAVLCKLRMGKPWAATATLQYHEHEWYPAEHLLAAYEAEEAATVKPQTETSKEDERS